MLIYVLYFLMLYLYITEESSKLTHCPCLVLSFHQSNRIQNYVSQRNLTLADYENWTNILENLKYNISYFIFDFNKIHPIHFTKIIYIGFQWLKAN